MKSRPRIEPQTICRIRKHQTENAFSFLLEGTKHEYGFAVDDEVVQEEWLFAWPNNRKQVWFEREGDRFKFGEYLNGPNESVKEVTRSNALFLSAAAQLGHQQLSPLYSWFNRILPASIPGRRSPRLHQTIMLNRAFSANAKQRSLFPLHESGDTLEARIAPILC